MDNIEARRSALRDAAAKRLSWDADDLLNNPPYDVQGDQQRFAQDVRKVCETITRYGIATEREFISGNQ